MKYENSGNPFLLKIDPGVHCINPTCYRYILQSRHGHCKGIHFLIFFKKIVKDCDDDCDGTRTAEFLGERILSVLISGKIIWEKSNNNNNLCVQNRSTIVQNKEAWQKRTPFLQTIFHWLILLLASIFF